ncbi:hypothetical protein [Duganella sp. BuS-21]|uniref:hypothetical protein n=1 Tax=Duganella sp. BuS-21 TaxID=2943848 RepID=UPI0035A6C5A4
MSKRLIAFGVAGVVIALGGFLAAGQTGRIVLAWAQSTKDFTQCTADPRIWCEPGAEADARAIAPLVAASLVVVERAHYGQFPQPVRIQVYRTRESFARHSAVSPVAYGATGMGAVHLSPRVARGPEALRGSILAHELSHLHLQQQAGNLAVARLPNWFMEGLPTAVSNGGGAEKISRDQAVFAMVHGRHFKATEEGSLWFPKRAAEYRLSWPMYYRQTSMMVDYMKQCDGAAFERMIKDIAAGKAFGAAVQAAYGRPLSLLWADFRAELSRDPGAAWPKKNAPQA